MQQCQDQWLTVHVLLLEQVVPRVIMIGGKAAPGYEQAKRIIKLASAVGEKVNSDPDIGDLLKVVFVPDYNVSTAEALIPGAQSLPHIHGAGLDVLKWLCSASVHDAAHI